MMRVTKNALAALLTVSSLTAANSAARDEGIAAFQQGRYSIALPKLRQAVTDIPSDSSAKAFLALTQAALGDCQGALPSLVATANSKDDRMSSMTGVAAVRCYSAAGENESAFSLLRRLELEHPNDADILYTSAKLHMRAFNDATFAMFQRTPASYRVHELSAEIFEVESRYSDAVGEYRKAIDLNPSAPDLHYRLGRAMLMQSHDPGALEEAAGQFKAELQLSPEDGACEFQLGQIAQAQGNAAGAKSSFERALALSPHFAEAMVALGKLDSQQKHYDDAIAMLVRATQLQPANEAAHYALLTAYRDGGQMEKAKAEKKILDALQKPPEGEFSQFLQKLGEKQPQQ